MAMNKAEKQRMADLEEQLFLARAWRQTEDVEPDLLPPKVWDALSRGWEFKTHGWGNHGDGDVSRACSSSISNGAGWEKTTSQRPMKLYSTRLLALRALRRAHEKKTEKVLATIDKWISEEIASPTPGPEAK